MTRFNHHDGNSLQIGDARIYYEQQGNPHGPTVLLLHGGMGTLDSFTALTPHLSQQYRLISVDSRGHGKSTLGSAALTYQRLQHDVEALIDHLHLRRVSVIGHSDGGIVGLRLAAARAVQVDKLVTLGAHWTLHADDPVRGMYAGITAERWRQMFTAEVERYEATNPQPGFDRLMEAVKAMWLDESDTGYPGETVRDITAELLVVRGDDDHLVSRSNAVELADRVPGARLLNLPYADHSVHETQAPWLLPVLDRFLQSA
ncbi:alpha/beta fold hydrolase [Pseudomonas cremoricolorata]|uniref:AB hydrolase-1 domain-containing protein n=1 Tax=Pseudomonas cremoricolorata TaxID=157783 RepID=A0A089WN66_9PSED|nr:alpha/beta fold hydrolase [Pseudomonas cremoricolorata]AIR90705.1 hypothetical protein LK03_16120 [Pseudomonas cremoricolorata]